jgi:tRNA-specific 2-thiouridylase
MSGNEKKVLVALSGGVDSSTAAALLCRQGYDCAGVFMITNDAARRAQTDAEAVAGKLGIKLHVLDLRKDFEQGLGLRTKQRGAVLRYGSLCEDSQT